jgi:hypothetical protein
MTTSAEAAKPALIDDFEVQPLRLADLALSSMSDPQ